MTGAVHEEHPNIPLANGSPTRIAILECDPLTASIRAKYGSYGGVVTSFLQDGAQRLQLEPTQLKLSSWNVQDYTDYPNLDDVDTIVITGSRLSAYDDIPWINLLVDFTKQALRHDRIRIVGLCFGHQIVGRALGAAGGANGQGYEMSVCNVDLTPQGQQVFGKKQLAVHQMHHDIITSYPQGVIPLGSSSVCATQGMILPGKLMTLQGHPEFDGDIMLQLLNATDELGFEDRTLWEDAMSRAKEPHDGTLVASAFLQFMRGELDE